MNGSSQAVRLPKEFRLPGKEVYVKKIGNALVLLPQENSWESLFESLRKFTSDFMEKREDLPVERRQKLFR